MAACGSLQHIFEKPLPENPTLLESLSSWKQIKSSKPIEDSTFTEIFGELHFKEKPESFPSLCSSSPSPSPSSSLLLSPKRIEKSNEEANYTIKTTTPPTSLSDYFSSPARKPYGGGCHRNSDSFSSMNSESLQLCTESLGFESCDDVEDLKDDLSNSWRNQKENNKSFISTSGDFKRSRTKGCGTFPPPISSIGKSGKPWVCFKSYRQDGRFVLKEIRVPTQEFLHASREDGRLKLQLLSSDDEILEEDEEEEEDDDEEEEEERDGYEEDKQQQEEIEETDVILLNV